jgi:serine protease Do
VALLLAGPARGFDKKVLAAFRPAIAEVTNSTVQILSDGKRAALGMVVDKDGYVLTKASELKGKLECQLIDGRRAEAKLVGLERKLDVAMLKVDWKDLQVVDWGDEKSVDRGSWIITPGLDKTLPLGIGVISAAPREIDRAKGALGIQMREAAGGAGIDRVMPKSPAEKAGLQSGDVVTRVGDKEVKSLTELQKTIFSYEPGDEVTLSVRRQVEEKVGEQTVTKTENFESKITLGNFQQMIQGERAEFQNSLGGQLSARRAGFPLVLQHDTVLKPQDCGGPLVDIDGKVVGVNIARAGRVETYALAASVVKAIIDDMKAGKYAPIEATTVETKPAETKPAEAKPAEAATGK